jgi:hypothetical protein
MGDYPNSGIMSRNHRKATGSKQPDYTGRAEVGGVNYLVSAWEGNGNRGPNIRFKFESEADANRRKADYLAKRNGVAAPAQTQSQQGNQPAAEPPVQDDIPF